jgi:hypothetical protein
MAEPETDETREAKIRAVMEELGVSRDAARLYLTIEAGDAMIDDRVSLPADQSLEEYLEALAEAAPQSALDAARTS